MSNGQVSLPPQQLATALHNTLNTSFFELGKVEAKRLFVSLQRGEQVPLMEIGLEDGGKVRCDLQLDATQFVGRLNFSRFRRALAAHLSRIADTLHGEKELNVYRSDEIHGIVYNHPGVIDDEGQLNFMLSGVRQEKPGLAIVQVFFVDPAVLDPDKRDR